MLSESYELLPEPDWKRLFYSLALREVKINLYLSMGMVDDASQCSLDAIKLIAMVDRGPAVLRKDV